MLLIIEIDEKKEKISAQSKFRKFEIYIYEARLCSTMNIPRIVYIRKSCDINDFGIF